MIGIETSFPFPKTTMSGLGRAGVKEMKVIAKKNEGNVNNFRAMMMGKRAKFFLSNVMQCNAM